LLTATVLLALAALPCLAVMRIPLLPCPAEPVDANDDFACNPLPVASDTDSDDQVTTTRKSTRRTATHTTSAQPTATSSSCKGDEDNFESYGVTFDTSDISFSDAKISFRKSMKRAKLCFQYTRSIEPLPDTVYVRVDPEYRNLMIDMEYVNGIVDPSSNGGSYV
ncbi:hypothetical protein IWQ60_011527, partial [Tieghemiomyces parasiticus]